MQPWFNRYLNSISYRCILFLCIAFILWHFFLPDVFRYRMTTQWHDFFDNIGQNNTSAKSASHHRSIIHAKSWKSCRWMGEYIFKSSALRLLFDNFFYQMFSGTNDNKKSEERGGWFPLQQILPFWKNFCACMSFWGSHACWMWIRQPISIIPSVNNPRSIMFNVVGWGNTPFSEITLDVLTCAS